jgi:hypothetical protein
MATWIGVWNFLGTTYFQRFIAMTAASRRQLIRANPKPFVAVDAAWLEKQILIWFANQRTQDSKRLHDGNWSV